MHRGDGTPVVEPTAKRQRTAEHAGQGSSRAPGSRGTPRAAAPAVALAIAAEALVAWTPADEPAAVEELPGREALANKEKKPLSKK